MPRNPDHPILPYASQYKVIEFIYHGFTWTPEDHYIEIFLEKGDDRVRLRFDNPRQLKINEYFPTQSGFYILDISSDGLEDLSIAVGDFKNGSINFFAKCVAKI
jgi:hypothetical protein